MEKHKTKNSALTILRKLGYKSFQPGQKQAITALATGKDTVAIMPTGSGKSLIYQITAEMLGGLTLVISPLIALMTDQAESAKSKGLTALVINSHMGDVAIRETLDKAIEGGSQIMYVSPERLQNETFMTWLHARQLVLVVVDEAHCISEWGHDFRPAYKFIGTTLRELGSPLTLALTATATQNVTDDIIMQLGMRSPEIIRLGTDRSNLYYDVLLPAHEEDKNTMLLEIVQGNHEYPPEINIKAANAYKAGGIIYTATTAQAEQIAGLLQALDITADYYHGQQDNDERQRVQNGFMDGTIRVVVATNAFGMGIDKPDVSFVIHYDVPPNIESYYQEAGRAGRGDQFAICTLLYRSEDMNRAGFMAGTGDEQRKSYEQGRREMMRRYAERHNCRRAFLLHYFGENYDEECRMCDVEYREASDTITISDDSSAEPLHNDAKQKYDTGDTVTHSVWGPGMVQMIDGKNLTILFESVGHKVLNVDVADEAGLLT